MAARVVAVTRRASTSSTMPDATTPRSSCASSAMASRSAISRGRYRCLGHVDAPEPARRGGLPGGRRARAAPTASPTASRTSSAPTATATRAAASSWSAAGTPPSTRSSTSSRCASEAPDTEIIWAIRGAELGHEPSAAAAPTSSRRAARWARRSAGCWTTAPSSSSRAFRPRASARDGEPLVVGRRRRVAASSTRSSRAHRFRPDLALLRRAAAGPRRSRRGAARAGAADRPQRALVRVGPAARRRRALAPRRRRLRCRDEELRPGADLPAAHRLRAGPLGRRGPGRRLGGRATGRARASRDRRLQRPRAAPSRALAAGRRRGRGLLRRGAERELA